jgi:hypothetical protein
MAFMDRILDVVVGGIARVVGVTARAAVKGEAGGQPGALNATLDGEHAVIG